MKKERAANSKTLEELATCKQQRDAAIDGSNDKENSIRKLKSQIKQLDDQIELYAKQGGGLEGRDKLDIVKKYKDQLDIKEREMLAMKDRINNL